MGFEYIKPIGGSGTGGSISIEDEGVSLGVAETINFVGADVRAIKNGTEIIVYIPSPSFSSHFGTTDGLSSALVSEPSKVTRLISDSLGVFDTGTWLPGSSNSTTNTPILNYSSSNFSIFDNSSTSFVATIYGDDDTTVLASNTLSPISGNIDSTINNIRIVVTGFIAESTKYKANIQIQFDVSAILPNGGKFSIKLEHNNSIDGSFIYTDEAYFYDPNTLPITIGDTIIDEVLGQVQTVEISGIQAEI